MLLATISCSSSLFGASLATDNAGASAYNSGWNATNAGTSTTSTGAWGAGWTFANAGTAGSFVASSNNNDNNESGWQNINSNPSGNNRAWGLFANSGGRAEATRQLNGTLSVGQSISFSMDNGSIANTRSVGVQLLSGTDVAFEFRFVGGASFYSLLDGGPSGGGGSSSTTNTTLGFSRGAVNGVFTLLNSGGYSFSATRLGQGASPSATDSVTGRILASSSTNISHVRLFNNDAGSGGASDAFFNNIAVVPEPSIIAAAIIGSGIMLRRRREIA